MCELKESLINTEKELQQKEVELDNIRAAEEREESENALRVEELQSRVVELESAVTTARDDASAAADAAAVAVKTQEDAMNDENDAGATAAAAAAAEKEAELAAMKDALESCRQELMDHMSRAVGAEVLLDRGVRWDLSNCCTVMLQAPETRRESKI